MKRGVGNGALELMTEGRCLLSALRRRLTQAVEAERAVVQEVADVSRTRRHGAEGVRAARRKRVEAGGQQEDEQGPVVGLCAEARAAHQRQEAPQEVPASQQVLRPDRPGPGPPGHPFLGQRFSPGGQEVSPDVDCLIGQLEGAEDTVQGRAGGAAVARHDAIFPEHLGWQWSRWRWSCQDLSAAALIPASRQETDQVAQN